jgi:hypothetical protein
MGHLQATLFIWGDHCTVHFVLNILRHNFFRLNYSLRDFSTSSAVTSGLNLETKRALDLSFIELIGKEAKFRTATRGCRRCLSVTTAGTPVVVFYLSVAVWKPSESFSTVESLGEGKADAESKVISSISKSFRR